MTSTTGVADEPRVEVRGNASPEELAAVLALARSWARTAATPDGYARWRAARLAALRHDRTDHERRS